MSPNLLTLKFRWTKVLQAIQQPLLSLTIVRSAPADHRGLFSHEGTVSGVRRRQAHGYDVPRPPDRPVQHQHGDVVVEALSVEPGVSAHVGHPVGLRGGRLVVPLQVYVTQAHRELPCLEPV